MKSLKQYLEDCLFTTPLNTIGMGNPSVSQDGILSEPICAQEKPTKRITKRKNNRKHFL